MNLKTIGFVVGGFAAGATTATAVFYFGIYKRYIPLKDLEQEIADLERKKHELNQQFKDNHEKFVNVKRSTDEAIRRKEQELDFYDDQIIEVKKEWEAVKAAKTYGDPKVTEQRIFPMNVVMSSTMTPWASMPRNRIGIISSSMTAFRDGMAPLPMTNSVSMTRRTGTSALSNQSS